MVSTMIFPVRPFCAAALGCGVMLLGIDSSLITAVASGLQHEHTLYGKCTLDDVDASSTGSSSFLTSERLEKMSSSGQCQRALETSKSALAMELNETPGDTESLKAHAITKRSSDAEIVARTRELLKDESSNGGKRTHEAIQVLDKYMKAVLKDSTVFALGLGPELIPLSKIANNVIAIEGNREKCSEFLKSEEGACAMMDKVHIYCVRPDETTAAQKREEAGPAGAHSGVASLTQISDTSLATPGSSEGDAALAAYGNIVKDLIHQQFGGVPLSAVVVFGTSAVAKLLLLLPYVDQSTIIVSRGRMTPSGLAVIGEYLTFSVGNVNSRYQDEPTSAESIYTMQRNYSPAVDPDLWMKYSTVEWELADSEEPFKLLNETFKMAYHAADSDDVSGGKKELLRIYKRIYFHALKDGTNTEWKNLVASLESIKSILKANKQIDATINTTKALAEKFATDKIQRARLQAYLQLMLDTAERQGPSTKEIVKARIFDLLSAAADIIPSPTLSDKFKDAVEDACELAEAKPNTFLPAIRLISGALGSRYAMEEVLVLLATAKRIDIFGHAK